MKRHYLCKVIGDGTFENPYRPSIADIPGVNFVSEHKPGTPWALCLVSGNKHALVQALEGTDALPDVSLDIRVGAVEAKAKVKLRADLKKRGIDNKFIDAVDGYREVIRTVGRLLNSQFHEDNFDVAE